MTSAPMPDYRKILIAYMRAVAHAEGITFVRNVSEDALTTSEFVALHVVEAEVRELEKGHLI